MAPHETKSVTAIKPFEKLPIICVTRAPLRVCALHTLLLSCIAELMYAHYDLL